MVDKISKEARSENMRRIRSKHTKPEMCVRKLVHRMGYRYRLHGKHLPGKPDLIFGSRKKVIFVHGCFWHQHPTKQCTDSRLPKTNADYWHEKLAKNVQRDKRVRKELANLGWKSLVIWECQTINEDQLEAHIRRFLS